MFALVDLFALIKKLIKNINLTTTNILETIYVQIHQNETQVIKMKILDTILSPLFYNIAIESKKKGYYDTTKSV